MNCKHKPYQSFVSQEEFDSFLIELSLEENYDLIPFINKELFLIPNVVKLKCKICDETWFLSEPDNAWRGFFLDEEAFYCKVSNLKSDSKKKMRVRLLILLIILIIISFSF